jgi:hypothetical protein
MAKQVTAHAYKQKICGFKSRPAYPSLTQLARVPGFYPGSFGFDSQAGDPASLAQQDSAVPF